MEEQTEQTEQAESPSQRNQNIYLPPELLTASEANEKARPAETPESRKARVSEMAQSILDNGQEYPVLVVEVQDKADDGSTLSRYEYVDGGCRVEAIAHINDQETHQTRLVWCSIIPSTDDLFRRAVTANLHRTANSVMDMVEIIQEVRERNGWKGRGTGVKVAQYLGLGSNRVSEYEKLTRAPKDIKDLIRSGEVPSLDAALKLMAGGDEDRDEIVTRSREIAKQESKQESKDGSGKPAVVKAKHVTKAAKEVRGGKDANAQLPKSKSDILEFFYGATVKPFPANAIAFATYFAEWAAGKGKDDKLTELFKKAVGVRSHSKKPAGKTVKKPTSKPKSKSFRPSKPSKAPKAAPVDAQTPEA